MMDVKEMSDKEFFEVSVRQIYLERKLYTIMAEFLKTKAGKKIYAGWIASLKKKRYKCMARTGKGLKERCTRTVSTNNVHCKQHEKMFIKMARDGKDLSELSKTR